MQKTLSETTVGMLNLNARQATIPTVGEIQRVLRDYLDPSQVDAIASTLADVVDESNWLREDRDVPPSVGHNSAMNAMLWLFNELRESKLRNVGHDLDVLVSALGD